MKSFVYICLLAAAVMLPVSESMRATVFRMASITVAGVERILVGGGYAEVRMVDDSEFDETINKPGRLVIVDVHHEEIEVPKGSKAKLDKSIASLPSKVLVAKVLAGRNIELMDRLNIQTIPTMRIYRDGKILEEFKGKVDRDRFMKVVKYHLDNPNSQPYQDGYIGPLNEDWLPEGIRELPSKGNFTPLKFDSE